MGTGMGHAVVGQVKDSLILITLLVELGVAAAVSASLARSTKATIAPNSPLRASTRSESSRPVCTTSRMRANF